MKELYLKNMVIIVFILFFGLSIIPSINGNVGKVNINLGSESTFEYVIITNENLKNSNFQSFIDYKSQYITATIVTVEEILSNPDFWVDGKYGDATSKSNGNPFIKDGEQVTDYYHRFNDTQAIIRNFIRYAFLEWNTKYILLGGDVEIIPVRELRIHDVLWFSGIEYEEIDADIRSDLYYACLDGTWNNDLDQFFGEEANYSVADEADFIAEVYVGRAPVDGKNDVNTFTHKVISFETSEKPKDILLHQSGINQFNIPDSTVIPETCLEQIPDSYNIHKLYQTEEKVTIDKWVNCFKSPDKLIILHTGSGYKKSYFLNRNINNDVSFTTQDVNRLDSTFYPIHTTVACNSGDFGGGEECLAEELILWQYGGPSACFFNTYYGFVSHNDALAFSGEFIVRQFYEIFQNNTQNLGKINQFSKEHFEDAAKTNHGYRWCYYTINLLGDPETPVFIVREKLPSPDDIYVDDDFNPSTPGWGVNCFNNIQDGINAAEENSIVHVKQGKYYEAISIDKTIDLIGENKDTTIIEGENNLHTITINANSTLISNFTIQHKESTTNEILTGIYISSNCDGNEIYNNIIIKNKGYGIQIYGSCNNHIHDNKITQDSIGIAIFNPKIQNPNENSITPCGNIIRKNKITLCTTLGIYIAFASGNHFWRNKFINNQESESLPGIDPNAFFIHSLDGFNEWGGNYWGEPNPAPKAIHGRVGEISEFSNIISENIDIGEESIEYDWNPQIRSYDKTYQLKIILLLKSIHSQLLKFFYKI